MSADLIVLSDLPRSRGNPAPRTSKKTDYQGSMVRGVDLIAALLLLIFLAPLMLIVAATCFLGDGGTVFFSHERVGRDGRPFRCLKFRSMVRDADARLNALLATDPESRAEWDQDFKLRRDPRVTRWGRFLRKSSLDELPQLLNVLSGDMSLVGPRPIVAGEVARYGAYFHHYCAVRPGITGLWQVSGRNNCSYRRRVACDVLYARNYSLSNNLRIIAATVPAVLFAKGSY